MFWQAPAIGESVYVLKVLTVTQCAEDGAELPGRGGQGGCGGRDERGAKWSWGGEKWVELEIRHRLGFVKCKYLPTGI